MITQRYKNDGPKRRQLWTEEAFAHPAKGHIAMWEEMVLRYSRPGDVVLDPMSGIGTTLIAALMGRNAVCVELEQHFVSVMRRSWEKMRNIPMLGYEVGSALILRGDARHLPLASADCIVTSPPFQEQNIRAVGEEPYGSKRYGGMVRQIKNTNPYTRPASVDAVLTSPPFQSVEPWQDKHFEMHDGRKEPRRGATSPGYTRPASVDAVLTSPPYEGIETSGGDQLRHIKRAFSPKKRGDVPPGLAERQNVGYTRPASVDAVLSSPPFGEALTGGGIAVKGMPNDAGMAERVYSNRNTSPHGDGENVGNLKGQAYWDSMSEIYAECWRVLRPGGLMALVLKGFVRAKVYQDLPGQTEALLLSAGWLKHDEWRRELWTLSFWRILQQRRDPAAFDERLKYETVLAVRKR